MRSRDSVDGIASSYVLDEQGPEFEYRYVQEFSLLHVVQTRSEVNPTFYPMGTGDFLRG
jgi:hypothetical protein